MVAAAGGAPAVTTRTPRRTCLRTSSGALASAMSTVGAAHIVVICSRSINSKANRGSTLRKQTCSATHGGDDPGECPSIGVEHRQRPEVAVAARHREMDESPYGIHVGVAVGDHDAFRARGRAACVVDREEITFTDCRAYERSALSIEQALIARATRPVRPRAPRNGGHP